jgi:predicted DNA-binding protein with PD1-like motif
LRTKELHQDGGAVTYAVIFETGDEVMAGLQQVAREHHLDASHFTAIGAFQEVTLGYFEVDRKEYKHIPLHEQVEVLSLIGDITLDPKGEPQIHAHVVIGQSDGTTRGGHLLEAHVRPTLEVVIVESPAALKRQFDPEAGLALIKV